MNKSNPANLPAFPVIQIQTSSISLEEEPQLDIYNQEYCEDETVPFQLPPSAINITPVPAAYSPTPTVEPPSYPAPPSYPKLPPIPAAPVAPVTEQQPDSLYNREEEQEQPPQETEYEVEYEVESPQNEEQNAEEYAAYEQQEEALTPPPVPDEQDTPVESQQTDGNNEPALPAETTGYPRVAQIDLNEPPSYGYGTTGAQPAETTGYPRVAQIDLNSQDVTGGGASMSIPITMCDIQKQEEAAPQQIGFPQASFPSTPPPVPPALPTPPAKQQTATRPLGWLVAVSGPMVGYSFPILHAVTRIGRAEEMEVALCEDTDVDNEQLHLLYSAEQHSFNLVQAPNGKQITRLSQGNIIHFFPTEIKHGEILNVSRYTNLRFIPFCDDAFSWESPFTEI